MLAIILSIIIELQDCSKSQAVICAEQVLISLKQCKIHKQDRRHIGLLQGWHVAPINVKF